MKYQEPIINEIKNKTKNIRKSRSEKYCKRNEREGGKVRGKRKEQTLMGKVRQ